MAIRKMEFVQVKAEAGNYKEMLIKAHGCEDFHVELATAIIDKDNGDKVLEEDSFYHDAMNELRHLSGGAGCRITVLDKITKFSDEEVKKFIAELSEQFKVVSEVNESMKLNDEDELALDKLKAIGLEKIHDCTYLRFGFGRLSKDAYKKLFLHDTDMFNVNELYKNNQYHWICFVTSHTYYKEVRQIFDSLYFEELAIPPVDVNNIICRYNDKINEIYTYCNYRYELLRLYKYVSLIDDKYVVSGFIPQDQIDEFQQRFNGMGVELVIQHPADTTLTPPTLLKNNWFVKPFEMFIKMYSLPAYRDFDPTTYVCITYCLLFGIMFSDLGQGLILTVGGAVLYKLKPKMSIAGIISRVGIVSMIFGFLFGSVFGNETLLNPLHQSIFHVKEKLFEVMNTSSTMPLLIGAVAIGAFLILSSMLLNMYLRVKHHEWGEFLFGQNGVAGFIFYGFIVAAAVELFIFGNNLFTPAFMIPFLGIPVACFILEKQLSQLLEGHGLKPKAGWGNYLLESFFEAFDVLLSFITNSMSYLRVGGFVLSHAGMMLVVMTLGEMTGNASLLVIILGNLFVMCLEGLIVGIQALRLEYYEMFSRYYTGGGREFKPITSEI